MCEFESLQKDVSRAHSSVYGNLKAFEDLHKSSTYFT